MFFRWTGLSAIHGVPSHFLFVFGRASVLRARPLPDWLLSGCALGWCFWALRFSGSGKANGARAPEPTVDLGTGVLPSVPKGRKGSAVLAPITAASLEAAAGGARKKPAPRCVCMPPCLA
jgi:hypothetical protein